MASLDSDRTAYIRIRDAALERFARDGLAATSIRQVARDAGVSAGLVQHHFSTKAALRDAVSDYVVATAEEAFRDLADGARPAEVEELGQRVVAHIAEHPTALLYVARSLIDGNEASLKLFGAMVEVAKGQWRRLAEAGRLRDDVDLPWAALHTAVLNIGTVLFEHAVAEHLGEPFLSPEGLDRWRVASTKLFERGLYRSGT